MAVNGFSNKVSSACASAIVAGLLAWGAYDGTAAVQSSKANMAILFAFVILPIIANIASIVAVSYTHLDVYKRQVLNPGTVVGSHTNIYPLSSVRGFVPAKSIYKKQGEVVEKQ